MPIALANVARLVIKVCDCSIDDFAAERRMAITRDTKNKLVLFLLATALVSLALYFVEPALSSYLTARMVRSASPDSVVKIPKLILWAILAYLAVRALNAIIFEFAFRVRKGYEAPTLVRNIFAIVAFTLHLVVTFNEI